MTNAEIKKWQNNLIMYYLRSQRGNEYTSTQWSLVAGSTAPEYKQFIDSLSSSQQPDDYVVDDTHPPYLEKMTKFFAYFVPHSTSFGFIDPLDNTSFLDLIHMFASMDATVYETNRSTLFDFGQVKFVRHASSWGGDLQTVCAAIGFNNALSITSMSQIFHNINVFNNNETYDYGFDWMDFVSDMYAVGIGATFDSLEEDIVEEFSGFFVSTTLAERLSCMVYGMASISSIGFENLTDLRATIYDMLALTSTGSNNWNIFLQMSGKYDHMLFNGNVPSATNRKQVADLFYNYIMNGY